MNSENVVKQMRVLWRTDRIIAEIRMRHILVGLGLRAFAALIAAFGLLMLELSAYFALAQVWSAISTAAILGIERRQDDIGHLGIAFGMAGLAGQRETELPELRRQGSVQDRLRLGVGSGLGHRIWLLGCYGMRLLPPP